MSLTKQADLDELEKLQGYARIGPAERELIAMATAELRALRSKEKRIAELETEVKIWKFAYTTAQTQIDADENGLIPLCAPGWKHDWIGDLVDGVKERIAELEADIARVREKYRIVREALGEGRTQDDRNAALVMATVEPSDLLADNVALRAALTEAKCYIGMYRDEHEAVYGPFSESDAAEIDKDVRLCETALSNPATAEALERVKVEARAELMRVVCQAMRHPEDLPEFAPNKAQDEEYRGIRATLLTALERVRREAKAEVLEGLIDKCEPIGDEARPVFISLGVLEDILAALRGGQ